MDIGIRLHNLRRADTDAPPLEPPSSVMAAAADAARRAIEAVGWRVDDALPVAFATIPQAELVEAADAAFAAHAERQAAEANRRAWHEDEQL